MNQQAMMIPKVVGSTDRMQVIYHPSQGFQIHGLVMIDPRMMMATELAKEMVNTKLTPEQIAERSIAVAAALDEATKAEGWQVPLPRFEELVAMGEAASVSSN